VQFVDAHYSSEIFCADQCRLLQHYSLLSDLVARPVAVYALRAPKAGAAP
jgi:hypothetical protein